MKLSGLQGMAASIAALEMDRAMSIFSMSGPIMGIREIKVGSIIRRFETTCTVKVIFSKDLNFYTEITFSGTDEKLATRPRIYWRVSRVVTHYHNDSLETGRLYNYGGYVVTKV